MKIFSILLLASLAAAAAERPAVSAALIESTAEQLDHALVKLTPADDPVMPVGVTQGAYIPGYGAVFMASLNLAPMAGISPFHPALSKDEVARIRQKKLERLPKLRSTMQDLLLGAAVSLDTVPPEEQITLVVSLFYFHGEDTGGLPLQIVMRANRKSLVSVQTGQAAKALLASAVRTDEF